MFCRGRGVEAHIEVGPEDGEQQSQAREENQHSLICRAMRVAKEIPEEHFKRFPLYLNRRFHLCQSFPNTLSLLENLTKLRDFWLPQGL